MPADVRPANTRFHTQLGWLDSWHSFSFSEHFDPQNTHHGLLLVLNDDVLAPGGGFGTHPHRDMEIVTWVLDGALAHRDSEGNEGVISPGIAQRMSAGRGIRHSEMNSSDTEPVHLLQMWVPPDTTGLPPGYEQRDVNDAMKDDTLFPLASGREADTAITIHQRDATLWVARLTAGARVTVPAAPFVHVFVATGSAELAQAGALDAGDAVRLTDAGALDLVAGDEGAQIAIWETWSDLRLT
ncbi:MAG TPA: pirin family protein [Acidimicrobiia bacterium]|nr:pirin family protein [Acidimicrobiia bacterium]